MKYRYKLDKWIKHNSIIPPMAWCIANCSGDWMVEWDDMPPSIVFETKDDLFLFKLAHGEE